MYREIVLKYVASQITCPQKYGDLWFVLRHSRPIFMVATTGL